MNKYILVLGIFLTQLIIGGCGAQTKSVKLPTPSQNENTNHKNNTIDNYGVYYAYKLCSKKDLLSNGNCKSGKNKEWHPIKNPKGQFVTPYNDPQTNRADDFYLILDKNKSSIFFSESFSEGYAIGWAYVNVKRSNNKIIVDYRQQYLTDDVGYDGTEQGTKYERPQELIGIVGGYFDKYKINRGFSLSFDSNSDGELSLDCATYKYYDGKNIGPISNLCDATTGKIWLKKIISIDELRAINSNVPEPPPRATFNKVDFGGYSNVNSSNHCSWEYSPMEYCDKKHISLYERALSNGKANFNQHYIVLPILEFPEYNQYSLVIIDQNTGTVHPLPFDWYKVTKGVKQPIQFSLDSNQICINGDVHHWRIVDEGNLCFQFDGEKFIGHKTNYMN